MYALYYSMFHIHISAFKATVTGDLGANNNYYIYSISPLLKDFKNLLRYDATPYQVHKKIDRPHMSKQELYFFVKLFISRKQ